MIAIVNETIVPIKNSPSKDAITIDEVFLGMTVNILWDDTNNYCYIETDYNYKGYIDKGTIVIKKKNENWIDNASYMVIGEYIDILDSISYDSKILISVMRGSRLIRTDRVNKIRSQVILPDGKLGWIRNEFIKLIEKPHLRRVKDIRAEIVRNAYKYLGKQFRWGGKSPFGLDSSGLTSMLYLLSGLNIWRDSTMIDDDFLIINKGDLDYGDLIFEQDNIAVYIGNNKFITSSSSDAVVVLKSMNIMDEEYDTIIFGENAIYASHKLLQESPTN